jgi:hypothetical protein
VGLLLGLRLGLLGVLTMARWEIVLVAYALLNGVWGVALAYWIISGGG